MVQVSELDGLWSCCCWRVSGDYVVRFFFFKQKTAYEIGTGDWSSDVCSSDLQGFYLVPYCSPPARSGKSTHSVRDKLVLGGPL